MTHDRHAILVGVDGSPESARAARWAAREALRRHIRLDVLCAYAVPSTIYAGAPVADLEGTLETQSRHVLHDVDRELRESHPDLHTTSQLVHGDARRTLVEHSQYAQLTVVGTRGRGRIPEVTLGSVALHVASHGRSPVAVIPGDDLPDHGPVLLGVNGLPDSDAAVRFAFDEAAVRDTDLVVVLAVPRRRPHSMTEQLLRDQTEIDRLTREPDPNEYPWWETPGGRATTIPPGESPEAHLLLAEQLAGFRDKYPDVRVHVHVRTGRPADALLDFSQIPEITTTAQLIVVGSRGRGGLSGLLLGSTGQQLITRAHVPVVIAPPQTIA